MARPRDAAAGPLLPAWACYATDVALRPREKSRPARAIPLLLLDPPERSCPERGEIALEAGGAVEEEAVEGGDHERGRGVEERRIVGTAQGDRDGLLLAVAAVDRGVNSR